MHVRIRTLHRHNVVMKQQAVSPPDPFSLQIIPFKNGVGLKWGSGYDRPMMYACNAKMIVC